MTINTIAQPDMAEVPCGGAVSLVVEPFAMSFSASAQETCTSAPDFKMTPIHNLETSDHAENFRL